MNNEMIGKKDGSFFKTNLGVPNLLKKALPK